MSAASHRRARMNVAVGLGLLAVAVLLTPQAQVAMGFSAEPFTHGAMRCFAWLLVLAAAVPGVLLLLYRNRVGLADLLLALGMGVFCLAAVEGTLYAAGFNSPRHLGRSSPPLAPWWRYDPVQGNRINAATYPPGWPINADGFGDTDPFDGSTGCDAPRRVLILGDSYTFGSCVSKFENTFAERLDQQCDALAPTTVWNTGMPGIGPPQELYQLKEYFPRLKPQVVVLGFCYNDFRDSLLPVGALYRYENNLALYRFDVGPDGKPYELSPLESYRKSVFAPVTLTEYCCLPRTGHLIYTAVRVAYLRFYPVPPKNAPSDVAEGDLAAFEARVAGFAATRDYLRQMKAYVEGQGASFLTFIVARPPDLKSKPTLEYVAAQSLFASLEIPCVEFRDVLAPEDYEQTWHWLDEGHRKVAERLLPRLEALLPK